jgi:hypothetical protein
LRSGFVATQRFPRGRYPPGNALSVILSGSLSGRRPP